MTTTPGLTTTASRGSVPGGETGVWVFIFADVTLFTYFFSVFMVDRSEDAAMYRESQAALTTEVGILNTFVLLTSSLFVVLAVRASHQREYERARLLYGAAIMCGLMFVGVKVSEYQHVIENEDGATTNSFFIFYFFLTGLHLFHLLLGLAVLALAFMTEKRRDQAPWRRILVEGGGCYWHMVDFLWIMIFPLLYLVR